jgi:hypothetical protein
LGRPAACFAVLTVAVACFFLVVSLFAFYGNGWAGVVAAAVAAWVCWFAAALALAIVMLLRGPQHGVAGVLGSMLIRMALPLAVGVFLSRQGGSLAEAGVFGMIVTFYLFTLAIETWLSVSFISRNPVVKQSAAA